MLLWYCSYSKIGVCRIGKICLPMILSNIIISQALWWFRTINDTVRLKGAHRHQYNMIKRCSFIPLFRLWLTLQKEVAFWTRQVAFTPIRLFWPEIHLTNSLGILGQLLVTINNIIHSSLERCSSIAILRNLMTLLLPLLMRESGIKQKKYFRFTNASYTLISLFNIWLYMWLFSHLQLFLQLNL